MLQICILKIGQCEQRLRISAGIGGVVRDRGWENVVYYEDMKHVVPVADVSIFVAVLHLLIIYFQQRK